MCFIMEKKPTTDISFMSDWKNAYSMTGAFFFSVNANVFSTCQFSGSFGEKWSIDFIFYVPYWKRKKRGKKYLKRQNLEKCKDRRDLDGKCEKFEADL